MSAQKVDVLFYLRDCAAALGAAKKPEDALRLLDAHDAIAELMVAASGIRLAVDHDLPYVQGATRLFAALARMEHLP